MQEGGAPGNGGAPIMSGKKDFFLAELIGDGVTSETSSVRA